MYRLDSAEDAETSLPYLESYIKFKFAFSLHQTLSLHQAQQAQKTCGIRFEKEGRILIFATGLLKRVNLLPIFGIYDCGAPRKGTEYFERPHHARRYKFEVDNRC